MEPPALPERPKRRRRISHSYRLPAGGVLATGLAVALRNVIPFTFLSVLVYFPWIAILFLTPEAMDGATENMVLAWSLLLVLLPIPLSLVAAGAITYGVVQQLRGKPAGLGECIGRGLASLGRILGTGLYAGLRVFIGYLLCIIPGIIETCRLFVAMPVAIIEDAGPGKAVRRSIDLTVGNRLPIFGIVFLLGVLQNVATRIVEATLVDNLTVYFTVIAVLVIGFGVVQSSTVAVAYYMLRKGRENVDIEALAAVFD